MLMGVGRAIIGKIAVVCQLCDHAENVPAQPNVDDCTKYNQEVEPRRFPLCIRLATSLEGTSLISLSLIGTGTRST